MVELDVWAANAPNKPAGLSSYHDSLENTLTTVKGQSYNFNVKLALRGDLSISAGMATSGVKLSIIDATTGVTLSSSVVTPSSYQGSNFTFAFTAASGNTKIKFEELAGQDSDGFGALIFDPNLETTGAIIVQDCSVANDGTCGADSFMLTDSSGGWYHDHRVNMDGYDTLLVQANSHVSNIVLGGSNPHAELQAGGCIGLEGSPGTIDMSADGCGVQVAFTPGGTYATSTVIGSRYSDHLDVSGDTAIRYLDAGCGNDVVTIDTWTLASAWSGAHGAVAFNGGDGIDTLQVLSTAGSSACSYIDLGAGTVSLYGAGNTPYVAATIRGFENATGSGTLIGRDCDNVLTGGAGNDLLDGRGGNDTLIGGGGHDTFRFTGQFGQDVIMDFSLTDDTIDLRGHGLYSQTTWGWVQHAGCNGRSYSSWEQTISSNYHVDAVNGGARLTSNDGSILFEGHSVADITSAIANHHILI